VSQNPELEDIKSGNRRALAKAITLIESKREEDRQASQKLLEEVLPHTGNSIRIGITGIPGVGKSTFIEAFGLYLIEQGKRVAVLAVDPSSPIAGGSILGDKTRMERLSHQEQAYIRPSPSGGTLGGVAQKTRETMLLCEAAGYDVILVETVGVGQSEFEVSGMVDFFMALMLPNAGDELQGIKKGIMELVDALIINKADGESINLANMTKKHYTAALMLMNHALDWAPRVLTCSAIENENIDAVWDLVQEFRQTSLASGDFEHKRKAQAKNWMHHLIGELMRLGLAENKKASALIPELEAQVVARKITPYSAAKQVFECL
jgi:LAO/AO transport system kinase